MLTSRLLLVLLVVCVGVCVICQEQLVRAAKEDVCHLNNCALFLLKKGFPYISILGRYR